MPTLSDGSGQATQPPSPFLALTELPRALADFALLPMAAPLLAGAPRGDGHPVLVLPGFVTTDTATAILRAFLVRLGHDARAWELGRNLGPKAIGDEGEKLLARIAALHAETGRTVSLVGWSLGGMMARLVAQRMPGAVRQVVTLGSPYAGNPRATRVWRSYQWMTGERIDDTQVRDQIAEGAAPLPMPATSIYSRSDGVVAWANCVEAASDTAERIEVRGSHCGLAVNPAVLYAVADRLARPEGDGRPFERSGARAWFYPRAA